MPYHVRFCIDTEVRCGLWFKAKARGGNIELERCKDLLAFAEVKVGQTSPCVRMLQFGRNAYLAGSATWSKWLESA